MTPDVAIIAIGTYLPSAVQTSAAIAGATGIPANTAAGITGTALPIDGGWTAH